MTAAAPPEEIARVDDFGSLLAEFRLARNRTRHGLAIEVGVDPSYLTRIEHGTRDVPRAHIVDALARQLRLCPPDLDRFYLAAGYRPPSINGQGWSPALQAVCAVENDRRMSEAQRAQFTRMVQELASLFGAVAGRSEP